MYVVTTMMVTVTHSENVSLIFIMCTAGDSSFRILCVHQMRSLERRIRIEAVHEEEIEAGKEEEAEAGNEEKVDPFPYSDEETMYTDKKEKLVLNFYREELY